jgi:uncharacterized protein (TIGR00299 family) protein
VRDWSRRDRNERSPVKVLYLDCFSGVAGDMLLGALLDAGAPEDVVLGSVFSLGIGPVEIGVSPTTRGAVRATRVEIESHVEEPKHRTLGDIEQVLERADLSPEVSAHSAQVFRALAEAEAQVHGTSVDAVHFHEVGAVDSIVDVVGCCTALAHLAPARIVCSPLVTGRGSASSQHGIIPVPGPAVLELARLHGIPLEIRGDDELVTPTGAALVAVLADEFGEPPRMEISDVGHGAGALEREVPNVVRAIVGESQEREAASHVLLVETNVDDATPEILAHTVNRLLEEGAQDAWLTPIVMKKGRAAHTLSMLISIDDRDGLLDALFEETTTLGARISPVDKVELERAWTTVEVAGETIRVKLGLRGGRIVTVAPEYAEAAAISDRAGLPLKEVYARALEAARTQATSG